MSYGQSLARSTNLPVIKLFWSHCTIDQSLTWSSPGYDVRYPVAILCLVIGVFELPSRCNNCSWGWGSFIAEYILFISELSMRLLGNTHLYVPNLTSREKMKSWIDTLLSRIFLHDP